MSPLHGVRARRRRSGSRRGRRFHHPEDGNLIAGGKDGILYNLNKDNLGKDTWDPLIYCQQGFDPATTTSVALMDTKAAAHAAGAGHAANACVRPRTPR